MNNNPYAPPKAQVKLGEAEPPIPIEILRKIRGAWIAGVISASITLAATLFAIGGASFLGYSAWELIDVVLMFGLTFGIYKRSRVCALLMLIYFVISKILLGIEAGTSIIVGLIFIYFYALGVVGTFQYHKIARASATTALGKTSPGDVV